MNLVGVDYFGHVNRVVFTDASKATEATFEQIGRLDRLEELIIFRSSVGDAGLAHVRELTNLTWLILCDSRVTDAGLVHLTELKNLTDLDLRQNQEVTDAGTNWLSQALPNVGIVR